MKARIIALASLMAILPLVSAALGTPAAVAATTQTIAAGTSATNLPTETTWPGAQNPPYICCWNANGQYVTFAFSVAAGSTNLALRRRRRRPGQPPDLA